MLTLIAKAGALAVGGIAASFGIAIGYAMLVSADMGWPSVAALRVLDFLALGVPCFMTGALISQRVRELSLWSWCALGLSWHVVTGSLGLCLLSLSPGRSMARSIAVGVVSSALCMSAAWYCEMRYRQMG